MINADINITCKVDDSLVLGSSDHDLDVRTDRLEEVERVVGEEGISLEAEVRKWHPECFSVVLSGHQDLSTILALQAGQEILRLALHVSDEHLGDPGGLVHCLGVVGGGVEDPAVHDDPLEQTLDYRGDQEHRDAGNVSVLILAIKDKITVSL